jgi:hypothetical protein
MADRNAYRLLAMRLKELRPHDFLALLEPAVSAGSELRILTRLVDRAEAAGDIGEARRLKVAAMRARAAAEHAAFRIIEAVSDEPDGADLVSALLGGDADCLLADVLLGAV